MAGVDVVLIPVPPAGPAPPPGERRQPARREGMTDEAGRFELTGIAPGRYTLRFVGDEAFGAAASELTVASGEQLRGLEVALSPVALVEGLAFRSGAPAAHVDLRFTPAPGPGIPGPRRTRSDAQGRFRLRVPQDLPLTLETPADPDRPNARWMPVSRRPPSWPASPTATACASTCRRTLPRPATNSSPPPGASAPPPAHTVDARFGDQVRLLGYDLPTNHVARGGQLDVTLHFQALASTEGCRLFVHLIGPGPFTNLDHTPAQGTHPVARWRPGETIRDRFTIPIPTDLPPGTYTLLAGFWRPAGNLRLPISPALRRRRRGPTPRADVHCRLSRAAAAIAKKSGASTPVVRQDHDRGPAQRRKESVHGDRRESGSFG